MGQVREEVFEGAESLRTVEEHLLAWSEYWRLEEWKSAGDGGSSAVEGGRVGQACEEQKDDHGELKRMASTRKVPMDITEESCSRIAELVAKVEQCGVDQCRPAPRCSVPRRSV